MQERWRKLEKADARPALELQASARRSAQEIEAIRRSRNFHNRGCQCRVGACRADACPCFARGDECFYKICSCFNCANRLVVSADATDATTDDHTDDDHPPLSRRLSQAAADLPVRTASPVVVSSASLVVPSTVTHVSSSSSAPPPKLRRRPTPARGMAPQSQVFAELDDQSNSSDPPAAPAAATASSSSQAVKKRVKRRKDKSHKEADADADADAKKDKKGSRRHHTSKKKATA